MLSGLANGYIRQFAGVGHGGPAQVPNHFAEVVLNFVDAVPVHVVRMRVCSYRKVNKVPV